MDGCSFLVDSDSWQITEMNMVTDCDDLVIEGGWSSFVSHVSASDERQGELGMLMSLIICV